MIIKSYLITGDSGKALEPSEEFLKPWQQGEGSYWVDVQGYEILDQKLLPRTLDAVIGA